MAKTTGGSPFAMQNIERNKNEVYGRIADMQSTVSEVHTSPGNSTTVRNAKAQPVSYAPREGMKKKMYGRPFGEQLVNK